MGFSKKIKAYFDGKGLSNRDVSAIMDGYSESLISRYNNTDDISKAYIERLKKYFPDIDLNYLLKDDEDPYVVEEPGEDYKRKNLVLIEEIEQRLAQLKMNLAR